jgi:hypothetical protein
MLKSKPHVALLLGLVLLVSCQAPAPIASADWCASQPCLEFFGITVNQLSSSLLVFILSFYSLFVGYKFYHNRGLHLSRKYWGISLVLGGIGAFAAGLSFQAFGYEIKCAGKVLCDNTSSFEIAYNIITVWSAAWLLLAISASFLHKSKLKVLRVLKIIFSLIYTILCLSAYYNSEYLFVSFEFLLGYISPIYLYIFIITAYQFTKAKEYHGLKKYANAWLILMITIIAYYFYLSFGFTELLWEKGIWFSANDVLHLGMMGWLYYLSNNLIEMVEDSN